MEPLIEKAREDMAKRLSIAAAQIDLVEATEVDWPDTSLGCPQPEMAYAEVITPGYLIILSAQGINFDYHTDQVATLVLCDETTDPSLPIEAAPSEPGVSPAGPVIIGPDDQVPVPSGTPCVRGCTQ
jgi:hypothetical protein